MGYVLLSGYHQDMSDQLPLLTLAVGLATGLIAAIIITNYSQKHRQEFLRYLLTNILLFNLLILAALALNYLRIHSPEPVTTPASLGSLGLLGLVAALKITWAYVFWVTTRLLLGKNAHKSLEKVIVFAGGAILITYLATSATAWALHRDGMLQATIMLFEVLVIGSAVLASVILWRQARLLPGGVRRTSLLVFGIYNGVLFGAVLSLLLAGWTRPGPQSISVLLANGVFLALFNVFPPLWLKYLAPLPVSPRGFYQSLGISKREQEVAECLVEGMTNQEIADRLFISLATVKDHNHKLFRKCGVRNRLELVSLLKKPASDRE